MASFRIDQHRRISSDDVAKIDYMPDIYLRRTPAEAQQEEPLPLLTIVLKTGERLRIEGRQASEVWEDYQRATAQH